jgi:hypothetical protein
MRLRAGAAIAVLLLAGACGGSDSPEDEPTAATKAPSASEPATEELVAAPGAIGPVRVGMTVDEANATGLFEPFEEVADDPCAEFNPPIQWKAPRTEELKIRVEDDKVTALGIRGGVETAEGVGIGSTYGEVEQAYPDVKAEPSQGFGSTVYLKDGDKWLGMGFDEDPDQIKDSSTLLYMEMTVGSKPATFLDGCGPT